MLLQREGGFRFEFPFMIHLEHSSWCSRVEKAFVACSDLSGCLLYHFLCVTGRVKMSYIICIICMCLYLREMTDENIKSRMFIILLMHEHHSHSLTH